MKPVRILQILLFFFVLLVFNCKKSQDPPEAPSSLSLTVVSQTEIDLAWADNSSTEAGFKVERSQSGSSEWSVITTASSNVNSYKNTGLSAGITYSYKVMAFNAAGNSDYSNIATASTLAAIVYSMPSITTVTPTGITKNAASSGGNITADGNASITARGVCWSTTANPTTASSKTTDGSGTGTYTSSITGLSPNTKYYIRAYATNSVGTAYGNELEFTTVAETFAPPTTTSSSATSIATNSATLNGSVNANGSSTTVSFEYGTTFLYGSTASATPATVTGVTPTAVTASLTGLTSGTQYHYRVKGESAGGTVTGDDITFTTLQPPAASTQLATGINATGATLNGSVNANGHSTTISFEYGTSDAYGNTIEGVPSIASGTSLIITNATLTGLTVNTTYHFRIKAISSGGTSYGNDLTFLTAAVPTLTTLNASGILSTAVTSGGNITSDGGSPVTDRGVCWNTSSQPTISNNKITGGTGSGYFTTLITGLTASTKYYIRAYATNAAGTAYGDEISFSTAATDPVIPTLSTAAISDITNSSATGGGNISDDGGSPVIARGICYNTTGSPVPEDMKTINGTGNGTFTSPFTGLTPNTIYFVRAYATNSVGTAYGNQVTFTTLPPDAIPPTVLTGVITLITSSSATGGGEVTDDGGGTITARGICWSTSENPTTTDQKTTGTGTGLFSGSITGLNASTLYYVRAYATNAAGTSYGIEVSFTTADPDAVLPTLTTTAASTITASSASTGGDITNDGGGVITARGVCYSTTQNPNISGTKTNDGDGSGSFSTYLNSLNPNTLYYVRAYATNSAGTAYGNQISLTTLLPDPVLPVVTTSSITGITYTNATSGGEVTSDGFASVTARGICWSTSSDPTTADSKTSDGNGTGTFTSSISGLTASTTYYVRAYATNSVGTSYGNQLSFTSSVLPFNVPTLTTTAATSVTNNSASTGGNISNDGGASVTARGVCYSTTSDPSLADNYTSDGTGSGIFPSALTGLSASTLYYVRAYATNAAGTAYGVQISFTTAAPPPDLPALSTTAISAIGSTGASSGGNITSGGTSAVTARGVCWATVMNPTTSNSKTTDGSGIGTFTSSITGLTPCTTYHVRAYATNSTGTSYGADQVFVTSAVTPLLSTSAISSITTTTATSGGIITGDCMSGVTARGVVWSTVQNPTTALTTKTKNGTGGGSYTSTFGGLTPCTLYYVRAYATNSAGTVYGNEVTFTTGTTTPTLTTTAISGITSTGATSGGNISGNCISGVTARGVCWNTSPSPTIANSKTSNGTGGGTYTSTLSGLTSCTVYYVRAYATNPAGTVYGNEVSFTSGTALPVVTTAAISGITTTGAVSGGSISGVCSGTVTLKGVCWSTSAGPTTANSKTSNGSGGSSYTSNISGLSYATTYYVRAYATNSAGTAYGGQISFTTPPVPPIVTTTSISIVSARITNAGGNVTGSGGATVTARGVCYSTSYNPTIGNSLTSDGSGTGSYTTNIFGLTAGTLYYVRAYATNSAGTGYGSNIAIVPPANLTDVQGNVYSTVSINNQVWMQENLRVSKYEDGSSLILNSDTAYIPTPYYHTYNNSSSNGTTYGYMYNGYCIGQAKDICPTGWHVPSPSDWSTLATNLGGSGSAGATMNDLSKLLKTTILAYWNTSMTGHNNNSLFYARGGGYYFNMYSGLKDATIWWASTKRYVRIDYNRNDIQGISSILNGTDENAFYIRCKKD